jgi:hypothetical protein
VHLFRADILSQLLSFQMAVEGGSWGMRNGIVMRVNGEGRLRLAAIVANLNSPQTHIWRVGSSC